MPGQQLAPMAPLPAPISRAWPAGRGSRTACYVISALRQEWPGLATALDDLAACPDLVTLLSH